MNVNNRHTDVGALFEKSGKKPKYDTHWCHKNANVAKEIYGCEFGFQSWKWNEFDLKVVERNGYLKTV